MVKVSVTVVLTVYVTIPDQFISKVIVFDTSGNRGQWS